MKLLKWLPALPDSAALERKLYCMSIGLWCMSIGLWCMKLEVPRFEEVGMEEELWL